MHNLFAALLVGVLFVSGAGAQEVYVDNVVVVLDASGSMKETMRGSRVPRISAAKTAIKEVMRALPQSTRVGLLVFGGQANGWVYPLADRNDAVLVRAIDGLSANGGTPLGEYMKQGADRLLAARKAQYGYGSYRLLVVTDGEANDKDLVEAYTPDIMARGIITDVIGVDMASAHTLARKVHSYRRADDPAALKQAIQEVFAEVGKTTDGQTGADAFEELAGFSDEMAMATIAALSTSGVHPIGGNLGDAPPAVAATGPVPLQQPTPHAAPARRNSSGGGFGMIITIGVITVVVVSFLKNMKRGR